MLYFAFWDGPHLVCEVCFFLNKSTSYISGCVSLNLSCDKTSRTWTSLECVISIKGPWGTFLVVQWLRTCLPMQGPWVQSLVQKDSTCCKAVKPVHHNYWACVLEPLNCNSWSLCTLESVLRNKKPPQWEARTLQWRVAPTCWNQRKTMHSDEDPAQSK